jgi:DNA-binding NarL/FixJ family response regulator
MPSSVDPRGARPPNGAWPARQIGVVVIDPVPLFREGLSGLIGRTQGLRLLGMTGSLHTAVVLCEQTRPDVVLVDSVLDPRCHLGQLLTGYDDALAVLSVIREPLRNARYLAATVAAGTHGVVLRTAEPAQLVEAVRRTFAERRYLDPDLSALAGGLGLPQTVATRQPLSRREYQVLQLIADGMENSAIAKSLFVSVETIRTHVKNILRKLHARDRAHAVAIAFRLGVLVTQRDAPFPAQVRGAAPDPSRRP